MADDAKVTLGAEVAGLMKGMSDAANSVKAGVGSIANTLSVVSNAFGVAFRAFETLAAGLLGGAVFKKASDEVIKLSQDVFMMSNILGISATQASVLKVALEDINMTGDAYIGMLSKMTSKLRENEERFNQLGVKTRDSAGNLLNGDQIMRNTVKTLETYKAGTDRNLASTELLGKGWAEAAKLLRLTEERMENAAQDAMELGLVMGKDDVEAAERMRLALDDAGDVMQAIWVNIGRALMPSLTAMANWFRSIGPQAIAAFRVAVAMLMGLILGIKTGLGAVWDLLTGLIAGLVLWADTWMMVVGRIMAGDFKGAWETAKQGLGNLKTAASETMAKIKKDADDTKATVAAMLEPPSSTPEEADTGGRKYKGDDKKLLETFKKELEAMKAASGEMFKDLTGMEIDFWEKKLAIVAKGSDAWKSINSELFNLRRRQAQTELETTVKNLDAQMEAAKKNKDEQIEIATAKVNLMAFLYGRDSRQFQDAELAKTRLVREQEEERKRLAQEALQHKLSLIQNDIEMARDNIEFQRQMGIITEKEKQQLLRQQLDREHAARTEAQLLKIQSLEDDKVAQQKALEELELMNAEYQRRVMQSNQQVTLAVKEFWDSILSNISSAFDTTVKGLIMGTLTWQQAVNNILQAVLAEFINFGVKILKDWIVRQITMTIMQQTEETVRATATTAARAAEAVAVKIAAMSEISSYAGVAGAAATASAAAIPYVGWAIAPAAGAAAFGAAMSYQGAALASAAGGMWEVPSDQLAYVHKKESILPASIAEGLRDMVGGGGRRRGGDMPPIHIHAMDSQDVERALHKGGALEKAFKKLVRNNPAFGRKA